MHPNGIIKTLAINRRSLAVLCLVLLAPTPRASGGEEGLPPSGSYCGIYSLYTALKMEHRNVALADLMRHDYVSTSHGSTLIDLHRAATECGVHAEILSNLDVTCLRRAPFPIILHVKSECDSPEFNHFILCVADGNGALWLYDPLSSPTRTSGSDLMPLWDGTGVAVSASPINVKPILFLAGRHFIALLLIAAIPVICLRALRLHCGWHSSLFVEMILQFGAIATCAALPAGLYHFYGPEGFSAQSRAVRAMMQPQELSRTREVSLAEITGSARGEFIFVDARYSSDFASGHLPDAINVPPDCSRWDRARLLAAVPQDSQMVVYCQSLACPYASIIARRLRADGFTNVAVFRPGYNGWIKP